MGLEQDIGLMITGVIVVLICIAAFAFGQMIGRAIRSTRKKTECQKCEPQNQTTQNLKTRELTPEERFDLAEHMPKSRVDYGLDED